MEPQNQVALNLILQELAIQKQEAKEQRELELAIQKEQRELELAIQKEQRELELAIQKEQYELILLKLEQQGQEIREEFGLVKAKLDKIESHVIQVKGVVVASLDNCPEAVVAEIQEIVTELREVGEEDFSKTHSEKMNNEEYRKEVESNNFFQEAFESIYNKEEEEIILEDGKVVARGTYAKCVGRTLSDYMAKIFGYSFKGKYPQEVKSIVNQLVDYIILLRPKANGRLI
ncbi:MAG: hypothetical protein ACRCU6_01265 [Fusobacteriaceae bacterium]